MLEALIPSKTRVKLLTLFLLNPEREYYVREIARMTEENTNAVPTGTRKPRIVRSHHGPEKRKPAVLYRKNGFFLYDDLQKIVLKTEGVARVIRENLAGLEID